MRILQDSHSFCTKLEKTMMVVVTPVTIPEKAALYLCYYYYDNQ